MPVVPVTFGPIWPSFRTASPPAPGRGPVFAYPCLRANFLLGFDWTCIGG